MKVFNCFIIGFLVSFFASGQKLDTAFVNESGITMIFGKDVSIAAVNANTDFSCSKKGRQVIVKAFKPTKRISPMSVEFEDGDYFITIVKYKESPTKFFHDFRDEAPKVSAEENAKANQKLEEERMKGIVQKKMDEMLFEKKEIQTIGGITGNIIFKLSNIKIDDKYVYFRFNLKNGSRMDFNIDYVRFQALEKVKSSDNYSDEIHPKDEDIIPYIASPISVIRKESNEYMLYAIPIFGISDRGGYKITLKEKNGNRAIRLVVKARDIDKAEYFK